MRASAAREIQQLAPIRVTDRQSSQHIRQQCDGERKCDPLDVECVELAFHGDYSPAAPWIGRTEPQVLQLGHCQ